MDLDPDVDAEGLAVLGAAAVELLCLGRIDDLAKRFGYMLAYDRDTATAIQEDLKYCLLKAGATSLIQAPPANPVRSVKYFEPNASNLLAVIECVAPTDGAPLLVELVVIGLKDRKRRLYLEDVTVIVDEAGPQSGITAERVRAGEARRRTSGCS
jgi:hypothetical protein